MSFKYFESGINGGVIQCPNDMYRSMEQAFINQSWENTSAKAPENGGWIKEQVDIGSEQFKKIEAYVRPTVADVSRGVTDTRDYLKLIFKCIDHETKRGLFYIFDDCYWIVHAYNHFNGLPQDIGIRRCNNVLSIIDPDNGSVFSIPCAIDYDMMSPNTQVSKYVITPNGHISVITQANKDTLRLFTINKRFVLNGRVFKINAYQNSLEYSFNNTNPTLLMLDMYLDEIHADDDIQNRIADNGKYDYVVSIKSENMQLAKGAHGHLDYNVLLNGLQVDKNVIWTSSDNDAITIDNDGNYSVISDSNKTITITATLEGNDNVKDNICITIDNEAIVTPKVALVPAFDKIRQYETIDFRVVAEYNGVKYNNLTSSQITIDDETQKYISLVKKNDIYSITCNKITKEPIVLSIKITNEEPEFSDIEHFTVFTVSMFG